MLGAILSFFVISAIQPILTRHLLVQPNSRSSHTAPIPQGAGIAVIAATLVVAGAAISVSGTADIGIVSVVFVATIFMALVGLADDINSIPILPRLIAHAVAVFSILIVFPTSVQIFPILPLWFERSLLMVSGVWFVNLVNFMDGLDWITAAEIVPVATALVVLGIMGQVSPEAALVAAALCGATLGFAPFNRPVAELFLGNVGSLPIGLLLGWTLLDLAAHGHLTAALLLPLYYIADATVTLLRRAFKGEEFWTAHRSHFYQRAADNGLTAWQVVSTIFVQNLALGALAVLVAFTSSIFAKTLLLIIGLLIVGSVMYYFERQADRTRTPY